MNRMILGIAAALTLAFVTSTADAGWFCPAPACCPPPAPVCCTPPPVEVTWCVEDPCTCCTYKVSACVPACCAGVTPCLEDCRKGFLGRKILTYKFPCCDHCVDVVITCRGKTIVRD